MNIRFLAKLAFLVCLFPLLLITHSTARAQTNERAQGTIVTILRQYECDIQIENGELLMAPLKDRVNVKALWGPGDIHGVPATVGNLAKYLRAVDINLNIVVSPGAGDVKIGDLKLRSGDMQGLLASIEIATEGVVRGRPLPGKDNWAFMVSAPHKPDRIVEAFNLSGYLQTLGSPPSDDVVVQKVTEVKNVILETLRDLHPEGYSSTDDPNFKYHPGTRLFIVTGRPEAIDVTRKIVNALPGQPRPGAHEDLLIDVNTNRNQN